MQIPKDSQFAEIYCPGSPERNPELKDIQLDEKTSY